MEAVIIQPIEALEQFPEAVRTERWLTALQQANDTHRMVILHFETRVTGVKVLLNVGVF